jgi:hypothetical protein
VISAIGLLSALLAAGFCSLERARDTTQRPVVSSGAHVILTVKRPAHSYSLGINHPSELDRVLVQIIGIYGVSAGPTV